MAFLRRLSLNHEEEKRNNKQIELKFTDSKIAWQIYLDLHYIFSLCSPVKIETRLKKFLHETSFTQWKGTNLLKEKCESLIPKRDLIEKSLNYFKTKVYRAWRAKIRYFYKELKDLKSGFKEVKYLVLMNSITMHSFEKKELRKVLIFAPSLIKSS